MTNATQLHNLLKSLSQIGIVELGYGPKHPTQPNPTLEKPANDFLDTYPFLKQDREYCEFLLCYAGANLQTENDEFIVDIFGFNDDISTNFLNEQETFEVDGYLAFWGGYSTDQNGTELSQGFLFDASGKRKWGIYRGDDDEQFWYYCSSFLELLEILLTSKGRMPLHP